MNGLDSKFESVPTPTYTPPPIESFFAPKSSLGVWPEHIKENADFREQIEEQRLLLESYQAIVNTVPHTTGINKALEREFVEETTLVDFYTRFADYLERDPTNARITLYFPFELLSSASTDASPELLASSSRCLNLFKNAWESQLGLHEVRANFVDGDVLEPELRSGDHPRVVKATHLVPGLVAQGILTTREVIALAERSTDPLLKDGIIDACEVLVDMKLLSPEDIEIMANSEDPYLRSSSSLLLSIQTTKPVKFEEGVPSPAIILDDFSKRLTEIESYEPEHSTPARTAWLRKDAREHAVKHYGTELAKSITQGESLPHAQALSLEAQSACIEALRQACLLQPELFERNQPWLKSIEQSEGTTEIDDALSKLYAHLYAEEIIDTETLQQRNIFIPKLAGPFSENLKPIEPFLREVKDMNAIIENDPYLSARVLPVTLVFGSQLKGYGTKDADADVAVFIQPGVPRNERIQIERSLSHVFTHEKIGGKAVLFWLDATEDRLSIHDWPETAPSDGESSWIHVLLGAAWTGDTESISKLHHHLLTNYFRNPDTILHGKPTRERWLEEMERDTLQYRLLHKGFERYYPVQSAMNTPHGSTIDGQSAFYDPRYRRMAAELYMRRVFLPKLEK